MEITKAYLRELRTKIDAALAPLAEADGIELTMGNATYDKSGAVIKIQLIAPNEDGVIESREAADFKLYATAYGLEPSDLGRRFASNGQFYTVSGFKPRAVKFPVLAVGKNGKTYKFTAETVKIALTKSAIADRANGTSGA